MQYVLYWPRSQADSSEVEKYDLVYLIVSGLG